ncbi:hypothetical protein DFH29DRAFT_511765 [Suillus ampliporus]|nr:hypothetical protein DFH29DRAFT_511765 [Suillus ampliporus]
MSLCFAISVSCSLVSCSNQISCSKYELFRKLLFFTQAFLVCLIMAIRTYALYGRSKRLLTWMILIMVTLAGGATVGTFIHPSSNSIVWSGGSCDETYTAARAIRFGMAWVALFLFDLLIFVLTVYKTCKNRGLLRLSLVTRRNIVDVIFHDGVMYFGGMTLINIPNIVTHYCGSAITRGNLAAFTSCISVALISRLMLNLHKSVDTGIFSTPAQDEDYSLAVLTTRVDVQSAISSHHW